MKEKVSDEVELDACATIRSKTRENMINLVKKIRLKKIRPYKCRCQPLKGNRIAADFGNKDSSNKNDKPSLSCNFNKATK